MDEPEAQLPWIDDPLPVSEAVEAVAHASMEDSREIEAIREQFDGAGESDGVSDLQADVDELRERLDVEDDGMRDDVDELAERLDELEGRIDDLEGERAAESDGTDAAAAAGAEFGDEIELLRDRVTRLERGTEIPCPSCGSDEDVLKSGVAAAVFASEGLLTESNVGALDSEPFVCVECRYAFTPHEVTD